MASPRELGKPAELLVMQALRIYAPVFEVRHSSPEEDLREGWDLELSLNGVSRRVDVTISNGRFQKKFRRNRRENRDVIVVVIDARWELERIAKTVVRAFVCSLSSSRLAAELAAELTKAK